MKAKINLLNIKSYLVGNFRYAIYENRWSFLIRRHILEQIYWRIEVMDYVCYKEGSCIMCGCTTTALQMSNKACEKPCYPTMLSKDNWNTFRSGGLIKDIRLQVIWKMVNKKPEVVYSSNELIKITHRL